MTEQFTPLSPEEISKMANDLDTEEQRKDDNGMSTLGDTFKTDEVDKSIQQSARRVVESAEQPASSKNKGSEHPHLGRLGRLTADTPDFVVKRQHDEINAQANAWYRPRPEDTEEPQK